MGSNLTEVALCHAAKSVSAIQAICQKFDKISGVPFGTQAHSTKSDEKDVVRVTEAVLKQKPFVITQGRNHHAYPKIHTNPLWSWKHGKPRNGLKLRRNNS